MSAIQLLAAIFASEETPREAWEARVTGRQARRGKSDDDKPFRAFTVRRKTKSQRRHKGTEAKVKAMTGFDSAQLDVVWEQVRHHLDPVRPKQGPDRTKAYFFLLFCYIHTGIRLSQAQLLYTSTTGSISTATFNRRVRPIAHIAAEHINLIRWENRLRHDNHVLHFPKFLT